MNRHAHEARPATCGHLSDKSSDDLRARVVAELLRAPGAYVLQDENATVQT